MKKVNRKEYVISSKLTENELKELQSVLQNKEMEVLSLNDFQNDFLDEKTRDLMEKYQNLKDLTFTLTKESTFLPFLKTILKSNKIESVTIENKSDDDTISVYRSLESAESLLYLNIIDYFSKLFESIGNIINYHSKLDKRKFY